MAPGHALSCEGDDMSFHHPSFMAVGAARAISPDGSHAIPLALAADFAVIALLEPAPAVLEVWLNRLEAGLGVNDAHRRAVATSPEAVVTEIRDAHASRTAAEFQQARRVGGMPRDPAHVAAVGEAERALIEARADLAADEGAAKRRTKMLQSLVRRAMEKLAQAQKAERDEMDLLGDTAESVIRARIRGEEVEARKGETAEIAKDEHGARIIHRAGPRRGLPVLVYSTGLRAKKLVGIEHAYVNGYLDGAGVHPERLKATADQYGEAYEIDEGRRSSRGDGGGAFGPKGPQIKQVEAGETLSIMRRGLKPKARELLDLICGQHMRVGEAAAILGSGVPSTKRGLRDALRLAGESWALAQEVGEAGRARAHVKAVRRILGRMRA